MSAPTDTGRVSSLSLGHDPRGSGRNPGRWRVSPDVGFARREVDRGALAHPLRPPIEDGVGHQMNQLVPNRPVEDAALAEDGQRQQVQLTLHERARREPRAIGRLFVVVGGRVETQRDRRRRGDAERLGQIVAHAERLFDDGVALALRLRRGG